MDEAAVCLAIHEDRRAGDVCNRREDGQRSWHELNRARRDVVGAEQKPLFRNRRNLPHARAFVGQSNFDGSILMYDVHDRLVDLLAHQFDVARSTISSATRFQEDLDADSLAVVELIMSVEETFEIEIPDEAAEKLLTVGHLTAFIKRRLSAG